MEHWWKQPHMRIPTIADLALAAVYAVFVRINLTALQRGDLTALLLILQECLVIGLALTRARASATVAWDSPDAMLAWCGTFAPLFVHPALPAVALLFWIGATAQGAGNLLAVVGTLHLGRSFDIVPAQRDIQIGGFYRVVRHPIYASELLAFAGFVLAHPSYVNGIVLCIWTGFQIARIQREEHFLQQNTRYRAYLCVVRARLIPGLW